MLQALILGLLIGAIYGLMGLGLALIYGVMRTVNFAHGALFTIGGYAFYVFADRTSLPGYLAVFAAPVAGFVLGWIVHVILLRTRGTTRFTYPDYVLIATFATSVIAVNTASVVAGPNYYRPPSITSWTLHTAGLALSGDRLGGAGVAILATAALWLVLTKTFVGRSWRAVTQSPIGATIVGIEYERATRTAFAVSCALSALAGGVLAPLVSVFPTNGDTALLYGFVVLVIGGLGSLGGAALAGLIVGVVSTFGIVYISSAYSELYAFGLMLAVLILRPSGLFTKSERRF
jgi:branched-chain amino acid transport system permease protein